MTEQIDVALADRAYPVRIGAGLLASAEAWRGLLGGRHVLVVSDDNIPGEYLRQVESMLSDRNVATVIMAAGESSKSLAGCERIFQALAALQASRDATVVAVGGGVVGDLAGFAAACWMRGIRFVQVPTTLLAMVDSSVGGKTGINLPQGKNLVGAFHQPAGVIADTRTLATLPRRELLAGIAEVVKYAAIGDPGFFDWLEEHAQALADADPDTLAHAIATSVRHKAGIVARDERESGERALLNFGHTFGHAIETDTGYARYLHGEAVAIGMVQAARMSARLDLAPDTDRQRLAGLLERFGLPTRPRPAPDPRRLLGHMRLDKKATGAGLRFVLWRGIGQAGIVDGIADEDILATLAEAD